MQLFQINQSEESSKITINAHTQTAHSMNCPLHELPITGVLLYLWIFPLVISSTGEAAEMCGAWLGQYEYKGEHNGAPYHVQTGDDVVTREAKNAWRVGDELGTTKDVLYHPPTGDRDTPPLSGWQCSGMINMVTSAMMTPP